MRARAYKRASFERGGSLGRVLVLNASYEPLQLVSIRRAVVLLLQEKAELVEAAEQRLRAQGFSLEVPIVIRLVRYIRIPRRMRLPCSRRGVLARDRETCQYCGVQPGRLHLTVDHVVPRSQGGLTTWDNVVAACRECNHRKGGRTPEEAEHGAQGQATPAAIRCLCAAWRVGAA